MSLAFVGDIHGNIAALLAIVNEVAQFGGVKAVIQVGDFGVRNIRNVKYKFPIPVYFIEGNHEWFEEFDGLTEVTEVLPNLFFVPRGVVLELDGRNVAFLGGAASIDKDYRLRQKLHWDNRENITVLQEEICRKNVKDKDIHIFVTHVPPQRVIKAHFDDSGKLYFGVGIDWEDANASVVEKLWDEMGNPMLFCGHMHRNVRGNNYQILDINQLMLY